MNAQKSKILGKSATGTAHSKLILVGEHAVVYGQPAIAIPFPLIGVESTVEYAPGPLQLSSAFYTGPIESAPSILDGIVAAIHGTLDHLNQPRKNLMIRIKSSIPPGKGLGSSASVAIAVIRSIFNYKEESYTKEKLLSLAHVAETYAHGAPSGIDSLTITSDYPVWYKKDQPVEYIKPQDDLYFVVADSGRMADTRSAIASIAQLVKTAPTRFQSSIERLGEITYQAKEVLEKASKEVLGNLLNEAQKELEALGVSDEGLNRLIYQARQEGALGAKLTGGGNGGCIIALAKSEEHSKHLAEKLLHSGAEAVWSFVLRKHD